MDAIKAEITFLGNSSTQKSDFSLNTMRIIFAAATAPPSLRLPPPASSRWAWRRSCRPTVSRSSPSSLQKNHSLSSFSSTTILMRMLLVWIQPSKVICSSRLIREHGYINGSRILLSEMVGAGRHKKTHVHSVSFISEKNHLSWCWPWLKLASSCTS